MFKTISRRQFIADGGLGRDGPLHGRPRHHPRIMRVEIREHVGRWFQRIEKPPIKPEQMYVGDRIALAERPGPTKPSVSDPIDLARMIEAFLPSRMQCGGNE